MLKIGEFSKLAQVSVKTLRYYLYISYFVLRIPWFWARYEIRNKEDTCNTDFIFPTSEDGISVELLVDFVRVAEDAGVTWWLESIAPYRIGRDLEAPWPVEALRTRIRPGPPK